MRQIGIKYHTEGDVYKFDGVMIPRDEPLIMFRGRDRLVAQLLEHYLSLRSTIKEPAQNLALLEADIYIIKAWQEANTDKVRTPR